MSGRRFSIINKTWNICRFQDSSTSQSHAIHSQSQKNREICDIRGFDFLNCESTRDSIDVPALIYDEKTVPDVFTLSMTFNDLSVSWNLFSKTEMRQILRQRAPTHRRLLGIEGLTQYFK